MMDRIDLRVELPDYSNQKSKTINLKTQQPKTRPLHHGATESRRKTKDRWVRAGPLGLRCVQNRGFDISNLYARIREPRPRKCGYPMGQSPFRVLHFLSYS